MGSRFFGGTLFAMAFAFLVGFISVLPAKAFAFKGGLYEMPYTDINVLSVAERTFFDQEEAARRVSETLGSFAVVYPDDRLPLTGASAEKAFVSGAVSVMSFSGLPNTFLGSMVVAKMVAQANGVPVLGVHTGYGDSGVTQDGPKVFFTERTMNRLGAAKSDPAIATSMRLLKARDLSAGTVTLVGYCLGALKVGNITFNLEKERPKIFPKLRALSLGLAVNHSKLLPASQKQQIIGNLDQFGRINAINEWDALLIPGVAHTIRLDNPKHLPIISINEAFDPSAQWLPIIPAALESLSDQELTALQEKLADERQEVMGMQEEVKEVSVDGISDLLHDEKLAYKRAYLSVQIAKLSLERLAREGREASAPEVIAFKKELAKNETEMKSHAAEFTDLNIKRSNTSDLYEYQAWTRRFLVLFSGYSASYSRI